MKNKNLAKQLNSLQAISPDADWKIKNRETLISQIYGSQNEPSAQLSDWSFYFKMPWLAARTISQPALVAILIFVFLSGGSFASVKFAEKTKPGDSLYIAKIISEKTQFALTFDEKEKARLGIEFAQNRVEEMNQLLAEDNNGGQEERVGTLMVSVKKEIGAARNRIGKIDAKPAINNEGDTAVFSANLNKDQQGIQISDDKTEQADKNTLIVTPPATEASTSATNAIKNTDTATILKEAEKLLNEENYKDTLVKLEEADKSMAQTEQTENGVATSTTK